MSPIQSAPIELAGLAEKMRPDWDMAQFTGALNAAHSSGWDWPRTFRVATLLMADPDASPRDLVEACRNWLQPRGQWVDPAPHADHARELLAEALAASAEDGEPA